MLLRFLNDDHVKKWISLSYHNYECVSIERAVAGCVCLILLSCTGTDLFTNSDVVTYVTSLFKRVLNFSDEISSMKQCLLILMKMNLYWVSIKAKSCCILDQMVEHH